MWRYCQLILLVSGKVCTFVDFIVICVNQICVTRGTPDPLLVLAKVVERLIREQYGSAAALARASGVSTTHIGRLLRGRNVSVKVIAKLAQAAGLSPAALLPGEAAPAAHDDERDAAAQELLRAYETLPPGAQRVLVEIARAMRRGQRLSASDLKTLIAFTHFLCTTKPYAPEPSPPSVS
jgi:transcriptional regulator with XRE-family HTH domain